MFTVVMSRNLLMAALACALTVPASAEAADLKLRASLSGGQVVSATESPATGEARAMLDDDNAMRVDLVYSDLEEAPVGAELRVGEASENGTVAQKLALDIDDTDGRVVGAQFAVSPEVAARIRAGEAYLVITTIAHPNGVIRGQLMPQSVRLPDETPLTDK